MKYVFPVLATMLAVLVMNDRVRSANAGAPTPLIRAPNGDMQPVLDVLKAEREAQLRAAFPAFPDILRGTQWIDHHADPKDCDKRSARIWTFSDSDDNHNYLCTLQADAAPDNPSVEPMQTAPYYQCKGGVFGQRVKHYSVIEGDPSLDTWLLDRPHITLVRRDVSRDQKAKTMIGLQLCHRN